MKKALTIALFCAVLLGGCTHNLLEMDKDGDLMQRTSGASVSKIDAEGNQQAAYHGLAPTVLKQDAEGNWMNTPGPVLVMSFPVGDQLAYIISPNDVDIVGMSYTPEPVAGQPAFFVEKISANISDPLAQHTAAIGLALTVLEGMTKVEAEATVAKWEAAGTMVPGVIDLLKLIVAAF